MYCCANTYVVYSKAQISYYHLAISPAEFGQLFLFRPLSLRACCLLSVRWDHTAKYLKEEHNWRLITIMHTIQHDIRISMLSALLNFTRIHTAIARRTYVRAVLLNTA